MRCSTWLWWTCAGGLLVALALLGLNRVEASGNRAGSAMAVATADAASHPNVTRDEDEENEAAEEREEHEGKEAKEHEEEENEAAEEREEHEHHAGRHDEEKGEEAEEHEEEEEEHEQVVTFAKADLNKVPKGWKVAKTGKGAGSHWKVVADRTAPSGKGYALAQTAKSPGRVFNLCVLNDSKYRDVEVKVCFKALRGKTDQGGGIVWRYLDANNYYVARMNPLEDNYRFYKVVNGRRSQLATKEGLKVPVGQWHTLEIECQGNKIECKLDGKTLLEKTDRALTKAGKVGLWTKADAQSRFDNFKVEKKGDED